MEDHLIYPPKRTLIISPLGRHTTISISNSSLHNLAMIPEVISKK